MQRTFGRDFTLASLLTEKGFNAVFLAMGAPLGKRMGVKGEDHVEGVESALDFLRRVELSGPPPLQGKVAVVGGGNSAIDAARTALRLGAQAVASSIGARARKCRPIRKRWGSRGRKG
jgi:NADPH-dependent glutamate synthase beta subunit-like oxidoreductase